MFGTSPYPTEGFRGSALRTLAFDEAQHLDLNRTMVLAGKVGVLPLPAFGKGETGVPGCDCPASAVYHLIDGTLSGLQECVISDVRAATRAGRAAVRRCVL